MIQRLVRTADLDKVYAAAGNVLSSEKITDWQLKAFKYYFIPNKDTGLGGIVIEPTADLLKLQQALIDAVASYSVDTATAAVFANTSGNADIQPALIDYVAALVPKSTGHHFRITRRACWPNLLPSSRSLLWVPPFTNSAATE